jgi:hypothetical protein
VRAAGTKAGEGVTYRQGGTGPAHSFTSFPLYTFCTSCIIHTSDRLNYFSCYAILRPQVLHQALRWEGVGPYQAIYQE